MSDITVILNGFKRLQFLDLQIDHINQQTVKPKEVWVWQNFSGDEINKNLVSNLKYAFSNFNWGVWARFAFALNSKTEYVCIFDDDTIPGERWFENCLNTMKTHEGLLGTVGVVFHTTTGYSPLHRFGWYEGNNEHVEEVDIIGHSWFFKREWLSDFWRELPCNNISPLVGEDIHFSHMLQKYSGIKSFVPPHPINDTSLWGSLPKFGIKLGHDMPVGIHKKDKNLEDMSIAYLDALSKGFIPFCARSNS